MKLSKRKIKSLANKMDDLNNRIKRLVAEVEESGHPNAQEMADTLRENGYDNPARALDCIEDLLAVKRANNACNRPASAVGMQSESLESAGG